MDSIIPDTSITLANIQTIRVSLALRSLEIRFIHFFQNGDMYEDTQFISELANLSRLKTFDVKFWEKTLHCLTLSVHASCNKKETNRKTPYLVYFVIFVLPRILLLPIVFEAYLLRTWK